MAPGAWLLPAPCTRRRPGRDLTAGMTDAATPAGALRIGLAHGAVQSFSEDGNPALIPPDRAGTAGLAFLALGDWHGQLASVRAPGTPAPPRPTASGTRPRRARFSSSSAAPEPAVTPLPTGTLDWRHAELDLLPADDPAARLARLLPPAACRRDTLLRVTAGGRTGLAGEAALGAALAAVEHDFAFLELHRAGLAIDHAPADLDAFGAPGSALRAAADALRAEADDPVLAADARAAALAALSRLYAFAGDAA